MFRKLFSALAFSAATIGYAQAPGGVTSGLTAWYRADVTGSVIGLPGAVSAWNNSGGSAAGYNLTESTPSYRPGYISGSTNYKRYNYNPRIDFKSASYSRLQNTSSSPNLYGTAGSIFLVTNQKPLGEDGSGLTYSSNSSQRIQMKPAWRVQTSAGYYGYTADFGLPTDYDTLDASMFSLSGLGADAVHRLNSVDIACNHCGLSDYNPYVAIGFYLGRNGTGGEHVDCDMGELIFYNSSLNNAQKNRVESYLAIKYGITRGGNIGTTATYNYVNSGGTTIWNKTTNAGFNNDIAGIGRDDNSALLQKQSISVNKLESVSIGLKSIDASNAANLNTFTNNNSFLVWGNDGGAQSTVYNDPTCFTQLPAGVQARVKRRWKAQVTNFSQQVTVGFEASSLSGYLPLSNLRLLVDNDGTNWTDAWVYSSATMDGGRIEFSGVSISAVRPYFTLATVNFSGTPLPVELLNFEAIPEWPHVRLAWSTASEKDNDHFMVERSADAIAFHPIGSVPGAGNSMMRLDYGLLDRAPLNGISYYRLRQVDHNGGFVLSDVRPVMRDGLGVLDVFPNPVSGELHLLGYDPARHGAITLYNALGERVLPQVQQADGVLVVANLPSGMYVAVAGGQTVRFLKE